MLCWWWLLFWWFQCCYRWYSPGNKTKLILLLAILTRIADYFCNSGLSPVSSFGKKANTFGYEALAF
jgi:hypothetical protein